jgi:phosphohistidine swiveling domain-containing protein
VEKFEPPSPGAWELESTHTQRPITHYLGAMFTEHMMRGFKFATANYGALLDHFEMALINQFVYMAPRAVGAPKSAKGPPPKLIFKLLTKLHPEIRKRLKRTREVFEGKLWREDVARWDAEIKPRIIKRNAELAAVEPTKLDTDALVQHLLDVEERVIDAIFHHHSYNLCALIAPGDLIAHVTQWTDLGPESLCGVLRGDSPVSAGATAEHERAVDAIKADPAAAKVLASSASPREIIDQLSAFPGDVGRFVKAYVDAVGLRIPSGYDVGDPTNHEQPEILVGALRSGPAPKLDPEAVAAATKRVRDAVPEHHRAMFDELLAEARFVYRIRDERGLLNDAPAAGLARRALLAAGDRLVSAGKLEAADHAVDLTPKEVVALLRGQPGPAAAEVAGRVTYRLSHSTSEAPQTLGFPPSAPPPADWLPPHGARMMRAIDAAVKAMFEVRKRKVEEASLELKRLKGIAASPGTYEGIARVVLGAAQFANVQQGDVLIARTTSPSYNVLLPLLGGIITDRGGLLSHAAIVAREYGLPAVVGTTDATVTIADGARVRIDGGTGVIQVLS